MDVTICHPFLQSTGGGDRLVLEMAKRFNPIIYSVVYDKEHTFQEFREFDVRIMPRSRLELPFGWLRQDARRFNAASAGFRYFFGKLTDYDVICAMGCPAEWIANRNERVSWMCFSPNREAFDLRDFRMKEMGFKRRMLNHALLEMYKLGEFVVIDGIEQITTTSEVVQERISKYLGRDDAIVIHPGVDTKQFYNDHYGKYFLYPSRFVPEKRFEFAIRAFREFSRTHKGWTLVLAGFLSSLPRDQEYFAKLKAMCHGLNVEFALNVTEDELADLYASCTAVLFCAMNEDYGFIPLEAMASGKPVISVDEGGPRYTIISGETGFRVASPEKMAGTMRLLVDNIDLVEQVGKAGRRHVELNYTWKNYLDRMEGCLKQVAGR